MADVVRLGCLFIVFLLNSCYAGIPGLSESNGNTSPGHAADNHLINEPHHLDKMMVHQPRYKCHQCEPGECIDGDPGLTDGSCRGALYCFKSSVRGSDGSLEHARGCTTHMDHYHLMCRTNAPQGLKKRHTGQLNITCCKGDMCNDGEFPELPPIADTSIEPLSSDGWQVWASAGCAVLAVAALAAAALFALRRAHRLRVSRAALHKLGMDSSYFPNMYSQHVTSAYYEGAESGGGVRAWAAGDSTLREYLDASASSGSGAGLPLMVQRTLAKQVHLVTCVGKGRFGEVWQGIWCADSVAVKIFFSRDEASWRRETEVYGTVLLRHENILAYVGSDMTSRNSCTQLWLITHYHPLGSLYDHLNRCTLTRQQLMLVLLSIVNGLLHLHTEIHGTQGKPGIAHRDIKSKNVLVKSDGTCCIADFGLAVTRASLASQGAPPRQGTRRYMSPELLEQSMDARCFEAHRRCDVYALALVFWEACRRTAPGHGDYRPPYHGRVPPDPSFDDMRKIVCVDGARPDPLPPVSAAHPTMAGLMKLMQECWHANPSVRLPVLRIKKTLVKLAQADNSINLDMVNEVSV